jgi:Tn3 transposase DDE domain
VDLLEAVRDVVASGYEVKQADLALLSPSWTRHITRFGDYIWEWDELPPALGDDLPLPI